MKNFACSKYKMLTIQCKKFSSIRSFTFYAKINIDKRIKSRNCKYCCEKETSVINFERKLIISHENPINLCKKFEFCKKYLRENRTKTNKKLVNVND